MSGAGSPVLLLTIATRASSLASFGANRVARSSASSVPTLATQSAIAIRADRQLANPQKPMNKIRQTKRNTQAYYSGTSCNTKLNSPTVLFCGVRCGVGQSVPAAAVWLFLPPRNELHPLFNPPPRSNDRVLFLLRKLIEALLLPIGISGLLTVAGVVLRRRWLAIAGVAILFSFSLPVVGRLMLLPLERVYAPKTVAAAPNADAIVVLNGAVVRGITAPGVQWGESANRFFAGIDLSVAGKAKVIVISSGIFPVAGAILRQAAIRDGIPPERIIVTPRVLTTEEEARAVSEIPNIHSASCTVLTSAFHMPRAVLLFHARGLAVSAVPDRRTGAGPIQTDLVSIHSEFRFAARLRSSDAGVLCAGSLPASVFLYDPRAPDELATALH